MSLTELIVDDLSASYDDNDVVRGVSLRMSPGQVTAFVGPTGGGKSTLLRTMAGLHPVSRGTVSIVTNGAGRELRSIRPRELASELTLLSQHRPVPVGATVLEVVAYGHGAHRVGGMRGDAVAIDAAHAALVLTDLVGVGDCAVGALSGGQLQRVLLASCIAARTPIMLLDEPMNYLDLRHEAHVLRLLRDLAERNGISIGVALRDLNHAAAIADDVAVMVGGDLRAYGAADDVLQSGVLSDAFGVEVEVIEDRAGRVRISAGHAMRVSARLAS